MATLLNPPEQEAILAAQTAVPQQVSPCPICQQTDQVRTIQAAFDMGVEPIAPPAMPTSNARMMPWIVGGFFIYLAGNFYLLIELAVNSNNTWPLVIQIISTVISLLALLVGLVLSYLAVLRIVRADSKVVEQYPSWDRAMDHWNRLYYCLRDNVVIDPQQQRVLSDVQLRALLATDGQEPREQHALLTHGDIHVPASESDPSSEQH